MSQYPVVDLHCDLLLYLTKQKGRTPYDSALGCSIPFLKQGGVQLQVLALFAETGPGSLEEGEKQITWLRRLIGPAIPDFVLASENEVESNWQRVQEVAILPAIENASLFFTEDELLATGFCRFQTFIDTVAKPLYISLTWNTENRFGGGNYTSVGLKEDGKRLLEFLHRKKIAVDLSHTSDALAYGILTAIDQHSWDIPILASHSNFRKVTNAARNLPDELALEIIRRKGLIGLNILRPFVGGESGESLGKHLEHAFFLGGEESLSFGADFFFVGDVQSVYGGDLFFPGWNTSAFYPVLLAHWRDFLGLTKVQLHNISSENFFRYFQAIIGI